MIAKGHLHVRFSGEKLVGDWHLVRTDRRGGDDGAGGPGKAQWLIFKAKDSRANPAYDVVAERPESVVSGRLATRGPKRVGASQHGASARALLEAVGEPALATAVTAIADPSGWLFEVKYDGYRLLAAKAGADVRLHTRRAHDWTERFRPIADAIATVGARECVLDGEACAVDDAKAAVVRGAPGVALGGDAARAHRIRRVRPALARRPRHAPRADRGSARAAREAPRGPGSAPFVLARGPGRPRRLAAGGQEGGSRGARREEERVGVRGGAHDAMAQAALRQAAGVRDRGLRSDGGRAERRGRPPSRPSRGARRARLSRGASARGSTRGRGPRSRSGSRPSASSAPGRASAPDEGSPLGSPDARLRMRLHRVDARRLDAPSAFRRAARGQDRLRRPCARRPTRRRLPKRPERAAPALPAARRDAPKLTNPDKVLFPRDGSRSAMSGTTTRPSRRRCFPISPAGRSRSSATPTASKARSGTSRTRPTRRRGSCGWSTRGRATIRRSESSATTSRRCSGSRTSPR